jgi:hypothetical protein
MSRWKSFPKLLPGDWLVLATGLLAVVALFATLWRPEHAAKLQIRDHNGIFATFSLAQDRNIDVPGPLGVSHISIRQGRVRFTQSPCRNQYCVHQGWLSRAGQAAVCLPNQISLELLGGEKNYDSLNY